MLDYNIYIYIYAIKIYGNSNNIFKANSKYVFVFVKYLKYAFCSCKKNSVFHLHNFIMYDFFLLGIRYCQVGSFIWTSNNQHLIITISIRIYGNNNNNNIYDQNIFLIPIKYLKYIFRSYKFFYTFFIFTIL